MLRRKRLLVIVGASVLGCALVAGGLIFWRTQAGTATITPTYPTITPSGTSIAPRGGWHKLQPPSGNPYYAYADSIDGVSIDVTEQQLPASFQSDASGKIAALAQNYGDKVTAGSTTVYIGTNASGPQSVIFTKNNLLILIKSVGKISDQAWTTYVSSLR